MITKGTNLIVSDNSGGKRVQCINVMGSSKQRYAHMGKTLLVTAKKIRSGKKVIKKKLYSAILIGTAKNKKRRKGYQIKFDENRVLLLSEQNKFLGTRIYGPICKELRGGKKEVLYKQIISYAKTAV
jgi:large subunit ribosomal protein L14